MYDYGICVLVGYGELLTSVIFIEKAFMRMSNPFMYPNNHLPRKSAHFDCQSEDIELCFSHIRRQSPCMNHILACVG